MRAWMLVIVGAVLPLLLGAVLGSLSSEGGEGTWAYPMPPTAFLLLSLGLALSHLLVVLGYLDVAGGRDQTAARFAWVGVAGTAAVAVCEVVSGLLARTDLNAPVLDVLDVGYGLSALLIVVGSLGAGFALRRAGSRYAAPLLVSGVALLVASILRFAVSVGLGIAALTVWSLLYVWLGLVMRTRQPDREGAPAAA